MNKLEHFFYKIRNYDYVVQRNFQNLPESYVVGAHDDLDLFCADEYKAAMLLIISEHPEFKIDVRSEKDKYYPQEIGDMLLEKRKMIGKYIYIPNSRGHFFSLYYHNAVHKKDNPYGEKLKELFLETFHPVKCTDDGVGFYAS